jgi:hypothetical protein
MDSIIG